MNTRQVGLTACLRDLKGKQEFGVESQRNWFALCGTTAREEKFRNALKRPVIFGRRCVCCWIWQVLRHHIRWSRFWRWSCSEKVKQMEMPLQFMQENAEMPGNIVQAAEAGA